MKRRARREKQFLALPVRVLVCLLFATVAAYGQTPAASAQGRTSAASAAARTPTETVREFYKLMRERRFREAFAISIYKPAVEGLSAEEFEEFRPDFESMAAEWPETLEIVGEQISGDVASVFVRLGDKNETFTLQRDGGLWIVGSKEDREVVKKAGKRFFFETRINAHHSNVQDTLNRISLAQITYASQHNGLYADLPALIAAGLVSKDIESPELTGYRFRVMVSKDAKSWTAGAEPVRYGQTGLLSFFIDQSGIRSADKGGKPLEK